MEKEKKQLGVAFIVVLVAIVMVSAIGIIAMSNKPVVLQGQIEATEIRISGKLPGRIDTFLVREGQYVKMGDTLVVINSPEAWAKFQQVNALEDIAKFQNKKIDDGTRRQIVRSVEELWNKSKSDLQLATVTYDRIQALYKDSVVTSQRKDEVEAMYKAAVAAERAAHQQFLLVKDGAQKEDKESARSLVDAARGTVNEVQALLMDARLTAPEDGQISTIYPKRGELVGAGTPIMSLVVLDDCHVVLNVREDYMPYFRMNENFMGDIPALDVKNKAFKPDEDITICTQFTIGGEQESIRRNLDADEYELLSDFEKNLEKIKDDVRIIATAARIENMVCENGQLSIEAKAIDHIQVNMRIRLPGKTEDLCAHTESGKNMELQSVWDEKSRTVLLSYRSNNEKVYITGKLKYES